MKISKRAIFVVSSVLVIGAVTTYFFKDNIEYYYHGKTHEHGEPAITSESEVTDTQNNVIVRSETAKPFELIDKIALHVPKEAEVSLDALADYFNTVCKTDLDKARAVYIWLTKNIKYDDEGYNNRLKKGDYSAEGVLKSRIAVCEGFSNLYYSLGKKLNLQIEKVSGYSKGYGYKTGTSFKKTDHAWNIIKIGNEWTVFDATWGEGYGENVNGKLLSKKKFNESWFNVSPYAAIFSHYPEKKEFINVSPAIGLETYEVFPRISIEYFDLGFSAVATYKNLYQNNALQFPTCYQIKIPVKVKSAPLYKDIAFQKPVLFEIEASQAINIAIVDARNNWTYLKAKNGIFTINYTPVTKGELGIALQLAETESSYYTFLVYQVR